MEKIASPVIGLPGRRKQSAQVEGFPETLNHLDMDVYLSDYARQVLRAGGLPVHIPLDADPVHYLPLLDGIVLPGGADIEPSRYGHENTNSETEPLRDQIEFSLLDGALEASIPVLGICRGLQVVNVHAGGTIVQDVPPHARYDQPPSALTHSVKFEAHSRLGLIYGNDAQVNSLHHQAVDQVGSGLTVTARAEDGTVEALEMEGHDVIAIQWHPEMLDIPAPDADPVFGWLIQRAAARRNSKNGKSGPRE